MADVRPTPVAYRIRVRGQLPVGVVNQLPGFTAEVGPTSGLRGRPGPRITTLSGPVADASALYGLIARLETLGLTLLSACPAPSHDPDRNHDPERS